MLLRQLVAEHLAEYQEAITKHEKVRINRTIINTMRKKYNSRFLRKRGNGDWVKVDEQGIRDKVSHALRFASIQQKKDEEYQKNRIPMALALPGIPPSGDASSSSACDLSDASDEDEVVSRRLEIVYARQQEILHEMLNPKKEQATNRGDDVPKDISISTDTTTALDEEIAALFET